MNNWHLYIIETTDNLLYTGITTDIKRRYQEHCSNSKLSAKFLRAHKPLKIAFKKKIGDRSIASKVEYWVKKLSRLEKENIILTKKLKFDKETGRIT